MRAVHLIPVAVAVALVAGCARPIAPFAPRRLPTPDHRQASAPGDCVGCHDVAQLRGHEKLKECLRCHRLTP